MTERRHFSPSVTPTKCAAAIAPVNEKIPDNQKLPEHDTRMAVFSCFAAPHEATESYISWKVDNKGYKDHWLACHFDKPEIKKLAEEKGVTLDFRGIEKYREVSVV